MIKVFYSDCNEKSSNIQITGHANFAKHGQDIVCSAISAISITVANNLAKYSNDINVSSKEGNLLINQIDLTQHEIKVLWNYLIEAIATIKDEYPKHIKIKEVCYD